MATAALNSYHTHSKISSANSQIFNWKMVCLFALVAVFCSLFFYAFQINALTKGTYLVNSYEKNILAIAKENRNLEVNFAESGFLGEVQQKTKQLNFEKTTSVKYIQIPDNSFAYIKK